MKTFTYKAYDRAGNIKQGEIDAPDRKSAVTALKNEGLTPFDAQAASGGLLARLNKPLTMGNKPSGEQHAVIFDQLANLLNADLKIDEALDIISHQTEDVALREILHKARENVRQGEAFSVALQNSGGAFAPFDFAILKAGERRGDLAGAARNVAEISARRRAISARLVSALIYPSILTATAIAALLIVVLVLAPSIAPMFERAGANAPRAFTMLMALSTFVSSWWWAIIAGIVVCAAALVHTRARPGGRALMDRLVLRVPLFGSMVAQYEAAKLLSSLASLLRGGAPLPDALREISDIAANATFRLSLEHAHSEVRRGRSLTEAMTQDQSPWPNVVRRFIEVGERTGSLEDMLKHAAVFCEDSASRSTDRFMTVLTPALTLFMAVFVGSLIAIILSTILSANEVVFQ